MNELLGWARWAWSERLGWTILHSLWQIAAITAVFAASSLWLRRSSPRARYALGCLSLLAMVGLPLATFVSLGDARSQTSAVTAAAVRPMPTNRTAETPAPISDSAKEGPADSPGAAPVRSARPAWMVLVGGLLPWLSGGWMLGVVLFSLRPLLGLWTVHRLRSRGLSPPPAGLTRLADNLVARFCIRRPIQFAQSALVEVPTVLGYLRPIVLLPASALTGLSAEQLELILAHELAHVRRHDYLVNVLQTGIETLLFYHPGTWWVSARVRAERENCCDDMAVELCGSRGAYVGALLALEQQRAPGPLALAASGGSLVTRARRLISPTASETGLGRASAWLAGLLPVGTLALLFLLGSTFAAGSGGAQSEPQAKQPAVAQAGAEAGTEADSKPAPAKPVVSGEAGAQPAQPKSNAGEAKAGAGGAPVAAEADPIKIVVPVTLEDDATAKLKIVLSDQYSRPVKTWENVEPGDVGLELPELKSGNYRFEISADGYSKGHLTLTVARDGIDVTPKRQKLYRRRYAVLRYAVNLLGERDLVGTNVKEGRVAISFGSVPDLHGDWIFVQQGEVPSFRFHRIGTEPGFAYPPENSTFEDLKLAPPRGQYDSFNSLVAAEKGMILFNRIVGNDADGRRYAKILVEDITETPPADIQVIDTLLPPTRSKVKLAEESEPLAGDGTSGEVTVTVGLEDEAVAPVKVSLRNNSGKLLKTWESEKPGVVRAQLPELPNGYYNLTTSAEGYSSVKTSFSVSGAGLQPDQVSIDLYRPRYVVLRYVINTKGERNLTGDNIKDGRVGILFGSVPQLGDWRVDQRDGQAEAFVIRRIPNTGFTLAREGATFDELDRAPPDEDYSPDPAEFPFEKGMILFNHVVGHRPQFERYAKLLVEEIQIIDARDRPGKGR
jgi:beta-lactamase regulating signal transducer with metallopeptidase domain